MDIFRIRLCRDFGGGGDKSGAESGIQAAGEQSYERAKQTPEEASQYSGSFDIGKFLQSYFQNQVGSNGQNYTGEQQLQNQGQLGQTLYNQTLSQAQNPDQYFQSTLQPDLTQAQDTINSYYQKRGLLNSGLAIESMGRAGVDLAIKDAQARMQNRQQSLSNALQVSQYGGNIGQNNLSNLANLYSTQQNAGLGSLSRQAGAAQNAATYQAYPYQAQLGSIYGGQAAQQALPGQILGGLAQGAGAAVGTAALGCWVASEIFGGMFEPRTVLARNYVLNKSPNWFREFYIKHGENIAKFISNKPILKLMLKPLFNKFVKWGA